MVRVRAAFTRVGHRLARKLRSHKVGIAVAVVVLLAIGMQVLSFAGVGVTSEIGTGGLPLYTSDLSAVPQSVVEHATALATELFGDYQTERDIFVRELLAVYSEAEDKDYIIFFNSGGWGWNMVENSPEWWSISAGIKSELDSSGYESLLLDYQRTVNTWRGRLNELLEMAKGYSSKGKELASRVEFLTSHNSDLKVILAGESNGAIICDEAMSILEDNPQVYSIQTGPPFWHRNVMRDRTLVLNSNGIIPDSFSQGHFMTMIRANVKSVFGIGASEDSSGKILHYIEAPGHEYWWQYPGVYSKITNFLDGIFEAKWR